MKDGHQKLLFGYAVLLTISLAKVSTRTTGFRVPKAVDYASGTSTTSFGSLLPKDGGYFAILSIYYIYEGNKSIPPHPERFLQLRLCDVRYDKD